MSVIGKHKDLSDVVLDPFDGQNSEYITTYATDFIDHIHNVNVLQIWCAENNVDMSCEPLFESPDEIKENIDKMQLSNDIRAQKPYFKGVQKREAGKKIRL